MHPTRSRPRLASLAVLERELTHLRTALDPAFRPDTAWQGMTGATPSAGHCAVVSVLALHQFGGHLVSATVQGDWHWFNRIPVGLDLVDVDLTADQFGGPVMRLAPAGTLYTPCTLEPLTAIERETWDRAAHLATRAGRPADAMWCTRQAMRRPHETAR